MTRLLEGVVEDPTETEIKRLGVELRRVERERDDARRDADRAKEDAGRALSMLRKQLSPLYRALQAVFGELDAAGVGDEVSAQSTSGGPAVDTRVAGVWSAWKEKLPPSAGRVIDALLMHGPLNTQQIAVAARMSKNTFYSVLPKMKTAGVITESGGKYSLKQL